MRRRRRRLQTPSLPKNYPYACSLWSKPLTNPQHLRSNSPTNSEMSIAIMNALCTGGRDRKPQLWLELFCVGNPSLSRTPVIHHQLPPGLQA